MATENAFATIGGASHLMPKKKEEESLLLKFITYSISSLAVCLGDDFFFANVHGLLLTHTCRSERRPLLVNMTDPSSWAL